MDVSELREVTRVERNTHGQGLVSWVYDYWNPQYFEHSGVASGLELGVQITGEWHHEGRERGTGLFGGGDIHQINTGESWTHKFKSPTNKGTQVGFAIYADEVPELAALDGELSFATTCGKRDPKLVELARALTAAAADPGYAPISSSDVRAELLAYVQRTCILRPVDPVLRARRELDTHLSCELKMEHIAETIGVHPDTLARKFRERFGLPPVRYRLKCRLDHAGRLLWSEPALSIVHVAEACGFPNMPFFHREFRRAFGSTPAEYRHRHIGATRINA